MATFSKITNRDSVVDLLKSLGGKVMYPPLSQCDFLLDIVKSGVSLDSSNMIVTGFNFPDVGMNFTQNNGYFGIAVPGFSVTPISMEFVWIPLIGKSMIHILYEEQFKMNGLIDVSKFSTLPSVEIKHTYGANSQNLLVAENCMFSLPVPVVNYKNPEFSTFKTNIYYRDIKYGL